MPADGVQILCVGNELTLIQVRCAVLEQAGYKASTATPAEVKLWLGRQRFDLVILSATLSDEEKDTVSFAAGDTPTLWLRGLIFPRDLLSEVESLVATSVRMIKASARQDKIPPALA